MTAWVRISQSTSLSALPVGSRVTRSCGGRLVSAPLSTRLKRGFPRSSVFDRRQDFSIKREARLRIEWLEAVEIEQVAQRRDLLGDVVRRDRKLLPIRRAAGDRPDVAFLVVEIDDDERLVVGEQRLDVLDRQRLRVRQRRIVGKLAPENGLQSSRSLAIAAMRSLIRCSAAASRLDGSLETAAMIALSRLARLGGEVLILAHKLGEPIVAGGKAHRQRIEGFAGGGLRGALHDIEAIVDGLVRGNELGGLSAEQDRQCSPGRSGFIGNRPADERQRIGVAALVIIERSQIVQRRRDIGMIGPERLLPDRQRPLVERLGLGVAALLL